MTLKTGIDHFAVRKVCDFIKRVSNLKRILMIMKTGVMNDQVMIKLFFLYSTLYSTVNLFYTPSCHYLTTANETHKLVYYKIVY